MKKINVYEKMEFSQFTKECDKLNADEIENLMSKIHFKIYREDSVTMIQIQKLVGDE